MFLGARMTKVNRHNVISFLIDCITAAEAEGYQQHEQSAWNEALQGWGHDGNKLWVDMGGEIFDICIVRPHKPK